MDMRIRMILASGIVLASLAGMFIALPATADIGDISNQFGAAANAAGAGQQSASLELVVFRIVRSTFGVIGVVLVGFMVYAGWLWMTAGDTENVDKAKTTIRNAMIGLAILAASYAISRFVIARLLQATGNVL